jgi:hypothetical protein
MKYKKSNYENRKSYLEEEKKRIKSLILESISLL